MSVDERSAPHGPCCCGAEHLTQREIEVLCLVATGLTNKQIAQLLKVSTHTVDRYVTVMLRRAHEHRRTGLISRAYRDGILVVRELGPEPTGRRCLQLYGQPGLR
jgi:DNA-binding NarL/FixJ family response regulator